MRGHKICFHGEIWIIIPKLSLLPLPIWSTDWIVHFQENGVDKIFKLDRLDKQKALGGCNQ